MPTIVDHDRTVELLRTTWSAIEAFASGLTADDWAQPTCLPGWSVQDQLSHLTGTEQMLLGHAAPSVDVSHLTHLRNEIAAMNEVWVESKRTLTGAEVLAEFHTATTERLAALGAMDQAAFDAPSWTPAGPDETYGRFMRIRAYDSFLHEHDMRAAVGAPDRHDPAALASSLEETAAALGYIVGRKAQIPEGNTVEIRLSGSAPTTYLLEVTDRARPVDALAEAPTVGIALDGLLFLRLTAGRVDAEPLLGSGIELLGDDELARQLATRLAYTL